MKKGKRIIAIIGVILLVACYITTLIASLLNWEYADALFQASLFCSCAVPIVLYGYVLLIRILSKHDQE